MESWLCSSTQPKYLGVYSLPYMGNVHVPVTEFNYIWIHKTGQKFKFIAVIGRKQFDLVPV